MSVRESGCVNPPEKVRTVLLSHSQPVEMCSKRSVAKPAQAIGVATVNVAGARAGQLPHERAHPRNWIVRAPRRFSPEVPVVSGTESISVTGGAGPPTSAGGLDGVNDRWKWSG